MKKVLLVVDNPHREMRGMVGIWSRLWKAGVATQIASKASFNDWYAILQPDVVVLPRATSEMRAFMESKASQTRFVVIPSEHGSGSRDKVLNTAFGGHYSQTREISSAIELASLILVGGSNQKRWIEEVMPDLAPRIKIVGTLNSDHWFKPKRRTGQDKHIGISTTFKSLLLSNFGRSVHSTLYRHLSPDYDANRWRLHLQNYELHYLACVFQAADCLVGAGYAVDIRPHPHEYWPGWTHWHRSAKPAVSLNRDVDLAHWIDRNIACITSFSTTALDCIARGVPSISLETMVRDEAAQLPGFKRPLEGRFSWHASSMDELLSFVGKAERGELPASPAMEEAGLFMQANFNWPRRKTAAALCVDELQQLLGASETRTRLGWLPRCAGIPSAGLKILAKDIRDYLGPRRSNLLFTFSTKLWRDAYSFNRDLDN